MIETETVLAFGWPNCVRLTNARIELIVTADVGPRIVRFGFVGGPNHLGLSAALQGRTGGDEWQAYGGHRLWHAPEVHPRTYGPDNGPVAVEQQAGFTRFVQPVEPATGIQKELDVALDPEAARAQITHRLRNHTLWPIELAPWALSVMAPGGTAILPLPPRAPHGLDRLLPAGQLTLWSYTDLADPRWTWGTRYVLLRQDPGAAAYQKVGLRTPAGWAAYAQAGELFVKTFDFDPAAHYPDFNTPLEAFTNAEVLELETLAPLTQLAPGAAIEHVEHWHLFQDVPAPANDADVDAHILPKVAALRQG